MEQLIEFAGNNALLAGAWVALAAMLVYSFVNGVLSPVKLVNTAEATQLINKQDAVLLDTRASKDYKNGHIVGARQIKPEEIREGNFSRLEKDKDKPIIVVCYMGNSARSVAAKMSKAGFEQVCVLQGGMNAWTGANLPVTK